MTFLGKKLNLYRQDKVSNTNQLLQSKFVYRLRKNSILFKNIPGVSIEKSR
jgi:hypothetical protein